MSDFTTGLFTLAGAFGGIWLKDHLESSKLVKSTTKQKAIEAFALANSLTHSLNYMRVLCQNVFKSPDYPWMELYNKVPNDEKIEKLELLIIENFYELNPEFNILNAVLIKHRQYLLNILFNKKREDSAFEAKDQVFIDEVIVASKNLKDKLLKKYINVTSPRRNIFYYTDAIKDLTKFFFSR